MGNDTDNDQGDKDFKDMEVKEEVLDQMWEMYLSHKLYLYFIQITRLLL